MPISLSLKAYSTKKQYSLLIVLLFSPLFFYAQTLTGLWVGSLSNDSTTSRKDQSFEIALTEYKGKVYGYSRSEFIVNDTLYYIVKRVKGTIVPATTPGEEDLCEVTDDEIVAYNFRGKLDKGIKVTSTFRRNESDSAWHLDGKWKTNATKKYYAVTGKVGLAEEKDLSASKIFPHLEELNLTNDIAFYKERTESIPVVKFAKPEKNTSVLNNKPIDPVTVNIATAKPDLQRAETDYIKTVAATETNNPVAKNNAIDIAAVNIAPTKPDLQRAETDYIKTVEATEKNNSVSKNNTIDIASVNIAPTKPDLQIAEADNIKTVAATGTNNSISKNNSIDIASVNIAPTKPDLQKTESDYIKTVSPTEKQTNNNAVDLTGTKPSIAKNTIKQPQTQVAKTNTPTTTKNIDNNTYEKSIVRTGITQAQTTPANKNAAPQQTAGTNTNTLAETLQTNKQTNNTNVASPVITAVATATPQIKKPIVDVTANATVIAGRKSEFSQGVSFKSDSLVIALYDNGEIDGDTVSVYMNGEIIMSRQGLKASAIKKTIHITPGNEDFSLVLFADNLGKYPPNTGLLVVTDGDDTYNLRFSSDFTKNAGIVFRRKK